ncbi:MAG: FecCD family ABC transporter permease [Deinococcales bacterium]
MRAATPLAIALGTLLFAVLLGVSNGTLEISPSQTADAIRQGMAGSSLTGTEAIVWNLRLPRVVFALLVGAALAASGVAMQGVFQNPLADPYLVGVASGAAFGATLAIFIGSSAAAAFLPNLFTAKAAGSVFVPLMAFLGACAAVGFTLLISSSANAGRNTLILSGVAVGAMLTALSTYIQLSDADRMRAVFAWTLGNLSLAGWAEVRVVFPIALCGFVLLWLLAKPLDALQLGEDTAHTLGIRVLWLKVALIASASLMTAAAVSFAGIIGFVGLVAPHIMRRFCGASHRILLPAAALCGSSLLVLADLGARLLIRPLELPVGVVTTLLGAPFFLWLMRRSS